MLDLKEKIEYSTRNLVQFTIIDKVFKKFVLNNKKPSIGPLNIGIEDVKGNITIKKANKLLKKNNMVTNLYIFVEENDISRSTVDILVTDGFTKNITLKSIEGTVYLIIGYLNKTLKKFWFTGILKLSFLPVLISLYKKIDPRRYNGAILLELNKVSAKSHGNTNAFSFSNLVNFAINIVKKKLNDHICTKIKNSDRLITIVNR